MLENRLYILYFRKKLDGVATKGYYMEIGSHMPQHACEVDGFAGARANPKGPLNTTQVGVGDMLRFVQQPKMTHI